MTDTVDVTLTRASTAGRVLAGTCRMGGSLFVWDWPALEIFDENHLQPTAAERAVLEPAISGYASRLTGNPDLIAGELT